MKTLALTTALFLPLFVSAADLKGMCQDAAINRALQSAPGIDPGSPATLTQIKLVSITKVDSLTSIEKYFAKTVDQGGSAASMISIEYKNTPSLEDEVFRFTCKFVGQKWVE